MNRAWINSVGLALAVILLAVGGPWLVREVSNLPRPVKLAARAQQRVVTIEIGGMTCKGCAAKVKSELVTVPGVESAEVRLQQRLAYVVCDRSVADTALTSAVGRAGPGFLASVR